MSVKIEDRCGGSLARLNLSSAEALRKTYQCSECGRWIKLRINNGRKQGDWPEATMPIHKRDNSK